MIGSFKQNAPALAGIILSEAFGSGSGFTSMFSGVSDVIALNDRSNAPVFFDLTPNPPELPGSKAFDCKVSTSDSALRDGVSELGESLKTGSPSIRNTIPGRRNLMMSDREL